jgi:deoxyribonuclease V
VIVRPALSHPWHLSEKAAAELQQRLASRVITEDRLPELITTVAGVDAAYSDDDSVAFAAVAVIDVTTNSVKEVVSAVEPVRFRYVPGLLSFREIPVLTAAFERLAARPDLVVCDGHGIAHPRRFGLACHLGVIFDLPTIGCAKTHLVGDVHEPGHTRGSFSTVVHKGETVGALLRIRDGVKPLFVSPGHRVSVRTACLWILALSPQYRLPEPIRMADQLVNKMKREARSSWSG